MTAGREDCIFSLHGLKRCLKIYNAKNKTSHGLLLIKDYDLFIVFFAGTAATDSSVCPTPVPVPVKKTGGIFL